MHFSRNLVIPVDQKSAAGYQALYVGEMRPLVIALPQRQKRTVEQTTGEKTHQIRVKEGKDQRGKDLTDTSPDAIPFTIS